MRTLLSPSASFSSAALFSQTCKQTRHFSHPLFNTSYSTGRRLLAVFQTTVVARAPFSSSVLSSSSLRHSLSAPIYIKARLGRPLATMTSPDASTSPTTVPMDSRSPRVHVLSSKVEKPELDDRSYRLIRLGDNKLEALLVHDPKTDKSSAAMDVHVGHLSDPKEFPGLAHALEHCLFLGNHFGLQSFANVPQAQRNILRRMTIKSSFQSIVVAPMRSQVD